MQSLANTKKALEMHKKWSGKLRVQHVCPVNTREELAIAYTPGVAEPCKQISENPNLSYVYTRRHNMVAVVTDGTAVLGLGDIGPEAAMPVMEGKCALFGAFADIDAFPLCIRSKSTDDIVKTVSLLAGSFGGINLEDISAPRCFEIESRLKEICDIPVFHDDQHGTAIVVCAALINALKVCEKQIESIRVVISGAGAAGMAIANMLLKSGVKHLALCDVDGAVYKGREDMNPYMAKIAEITNLENTMGGLVQLLAGADVFVGVSAPGIVTEDMVSSMNEKAIVFAMANPVPEIMPDIAKAAGAAVVGTGRSDFANQINNVLAFPGVFRGALDVRAAQINDEMKFAAATAIASYIPEKKLCADCIIPSPLDKGVAAAVATAVAKAAHESGVARI